MHGIAMLYVYAPYLLCTAEIEAPTRRAVLWMDTIVPTGGAGAAEEQNSAVAYSPLYLQEEQQPGQEQCRGILATVPAGGAAARNRAVQ